MRSLLRNFIVISLICIGCQLNNISGETVTAKSPSYEDIKAAIQSASPGDTVVIPAGTATWTSTLSYSKGIHLQGAGAGNTVITSTGTAIRVTGQEGAQWTISGFEFRSGSSDPQILALGTCKNFRIHHCRFVGTQASGAHACISVGGGDWDSYHQQFGVIDNCEIINRRIWIYAGLGEESWKEPYTFGSADAVYVEDCTFRYPSGIMFNVIDSNGGGRFVFRHNYIEDAFIMSHSLMNGWSTYFMRGTRITEVYENKIEAKQPDYTRFAAIFLRSGTGVVFNNKVINLPTGNRYDLAVAIDNVRTYETKSGLLGRADGSNPIDGNEEEKGYPALDQIGRGQDLGPKGDPIPRYDAKNRTPQALVPMYIWNNTLNGVVQMPYVHNNCGIHVKENRDYYTTPKPNYTPYPYPHPLRSQDLD